MSLEAKIDAVKAAVKQHKLDEDNLRREEPLIRYWDSEYSLKGVGGAERNAKFAWVSNDTGQGQVELDFDHPIAQWIHDTEGRVARGEGRTVNLTVDYCGARWSGFLDKYVVEQGSDGDVVLKADFNHDYEHVKWVSCWSNPYLNTAIQLPRAWMCAGPLDWALKHTLLVNLVREHNPNLTWPADPLDKDNWAGPHRTGLDQSQWHMAVHPGTFLESMNAGIMWGVVTSRFATFHDVAHILLEDSELSVRCDRWLVGDPPPWEDGDGNPYVPRHGQLIINIVDKSGIFVGTNHGGNLFDGLKRTIVDFADSFIDSTSELIDDAPAPVDYFSPGNKYTTPEKPFVVFREGETSPIESSQWIHSPSKGIQVLVGGHSMPGVNEVIGATISGVADLWGTLILIGGLGNSIDQILKPLYEDCFLAWQTAKSKERSENTGWSRLFEFFQQGANNAYTVAGLLVLRAGFWATKTATSWKVNVADGLPFLIGDRGKGHFFLDDRIGIVLTGDTQIHMDRARKLELGWTEEAPPEWQISVGDERNLQDPAQRALGRIEKIIAGMRDLGVY